MIGYLGFIVAKVLLGIVQALPLPVVIRVARLLAGIVWIFDSRHRKVIRHNLTIAFGCDPGHHQLVRATYRRFVENILTAAWIGKRTDIELKPLI